MLKGKCIAFTAFIISKKGREETGRRETKHKDTLSTHSEKPVKEPQTCKHFNTKYNEVKVTDFTNIYV